MYIATSWIASVLLSFWLKLHAEPLDLVVYSFLASMPYYIWLILREDSPGEWFRLVARFRNREDAVTWMGVCVYLDSFGERPTAFRLVRTIAFR